MIASRKYNLSTIVMMQFGRYRNGKLLLLGFSLFVLLCTYAYRKHAKSTTAKYNVMVWWSPYVKQLDYHRKCGEIECRFTSDRRVQMDPFFSGYLFHGSKVSIYDMPSNRRIDQYWGLYYDTSPKDAPFLLHALDIFNFSSTFSRYSTVPLTLQSFTTLEELINYKNMYTFGQKSNFQRKMKMAPVLYIQSRCDTLTGRELYVKELSKYILIDSYGACLNNKTLPNGITDNSMNVTDVRNFYDFASKYKFIIVYQDMICEDYIIDKFWKSLSLGIVPIYFGATNIRRYLPNPNSAILIEDFSSPQELAQFISQVSNNEDVYTTFLYHKTMDFYPISNQLLVNAIFKEDIMYLESRRTRSIVEFECTACVQSYHQEHHQSHQKEISCELPYFPPGNFTLKALPRVQEFIEKARMEAAIVHKMADVRAT
ncbi:alpha-(1,3)-fucosyltransferase 10 [Armigeres subalbatus]|uniref:alpha-(1,3)-fucosyltransferase 10 n=1 Tax=Armigeres subalbatus TaxID=124917 RepID=UPI002ED3C84A